MKCYILIGCCERELEVSGPFADKADAVEEMLKQMAEALRTDVIEVKALYNRYLQDASCFCPDTDINDYVCDEDYGFTDDGAWSNTHNLNCDWKIAELCQENDHENT